MKLFREELERKRQERRQKRSATWSGLVVKIAIFLLLIMLIRFIISPDGRKFGEYWRSVFSETGQSVEAKGDKMIEN